MTQPLDINKLARKAVETDIQQYFTDCLTPDRKYETPIDNVLALITKLAAEKDAEIARHKAALKVATDALKIAIASPYSGSVAKNALAQIKKELKP